MTTQATYNFPSIISAESKPQGGSAWDKISPTNAAINQHALLGDQVKVVYKAHGVENRAMINPPARKPSATKYDHKVGSFAWNNLSVHTIKTHYPHKTSKNLVVTIPSIAGHNLAAKLAELSKSGVKAAVVGDRRMDATDLKKFEAYVSGESAPKIDKTPVNKEGNVIKEYTLADMQIATYDAAKTDENKYGYARFTFAGKVWFTDATKDECIATFGKAPYWHRGANCYILPVADFGTTFSLEALQECMNLSATLDNAPVIESKPELQAAAISPTPVAQAVTPEQIAAIVAQAVAAALSAIK